MDRGKVRTTGRLDYVYTIKKVIFTPLKNTNIGRTGNCVSSQWKLKNGKDILQIVKAQKTILKTTPSRNKNVSGETEPIRNSNSGTNEKGSNSSYLELKQSISQQKFSDTEKRRLFLPNYEFKKFKPIHSIFTYENGKSKASKISIAIKRFNGKITYLSNILIGVRWKP